MGEEGDPLGIVQKVEIHHTNKWYMHNLESVQENNTRKILGMLRYKRIFWSRSDDQAWWESTKKKKESTE